MTRATRLPLSRVIALVVLVIPGAVASAFVDQLLAYSMWLLVPLALLIAVAVWAVRRFLAERRVLARTGGQEAEQ